MQSGYF